MIDLEFMKLVVYVKVVIKFLEFEYMMIFRIIEDFEQYYVVLGEVLWVKEMGYFIVVYWFIIEVLLFCVFVMCGLEGLDCFLCGDGGLFVCIGDDKILIMLDWCGNNRLDILCNIVCDLCVVLMFMVFGWNNVLCVNGWVVFFVDLNFFEFFVVDGKVL